MSSRLVQGKVVESIRRANDLPYRQPPIFDQVGPAQGGPAILFTGTRDPSSADAHTVDVSVRIVVNPICEVGGVATNGYDTPASAILPFLDIRQDWQLEWDSDTHITCVAAVWWPVGVWHRESGGITHCGELYFTLSPGTTSPNWQPADAYTTSCWWSEAPTSSNNGHVCLFKADIGNKSVIDSLGYVYLGTAMRKVVDGSWSPSLQSDKYGTRINQDANQIADIFHTNDRALDLPSMWNDNPIRFIFYPASTNYVQWFSPDGSSKTLNIPDSTDATIYYQIKADQLSLSATADGSSGQDIELAEVKVDASGNLVKWVINRHPIERLRNTMTVVTDVTGAGISTTKRDLYDFGYGRRYDEY